VHVLSDDWRCGGGQEASSIHHRTGCTQVGGVNIIADEGPPNCQGKTQTRMRQPNSPCAQARMTPATYHKERPAPPNRGGGGGEGGGRDGMKRARQRECGGDGARVWCDKSAAHTSLVRFLFLPRPREQSGRLPCARQIGSVTTEGGEDAT
jgi:hypothetical protein